MVSTARCLAVAALLVGGFSAALASAQDVPADVIAEAQAHFQQGQAAAIEGRAADAARSFARSLELVPRASTAYNLAYTYRGEGELLDSRSVLRSALGGDYGELGEFESLFAQLLVEVEASLAAVALQLELEEPADHDAWLEVNGERQSISLGEHRFEVDPGLTVLRFGAERHIPETERVELGPGEERAVAFSLRRERVPGTLTVVTEDPTANIEVAGVGSAVGRLSRELQPGTYDIVVDSSDGQTERTVELRSRQRLELLIERVGSGVSPWLVVGIVAGAVAIGAAIAVGVIFATQDPDLVEDPFWGQTAVLR